MALRDWLKSKEDKQQEEVSKRIAEIKEEVFRSKNYAKGIDDLTSLSFKYESLKRKIDEEIKIFQDIFDTVEEDKEKGNLLVIKWQLTYTIQQCSDLKDYWDDELAHIDDINSEKYIEISNTVDEIEMEIENAQKSLNAVNYDLTDSRLRSSAGGGRVDNMSASAMESYNRLLEIRKRRERSGSSVDTSKTIDEYAKNRAERSQRIAKMGTPQSVASATASIHDMYGNKSTAIPDVNARKRKEERDARIKEKRAALLGKQNEQDAEIRAKLTEVDSDISEAEKDIKS